MKPGSTFAPLSFFRSLILPILFILPYIWLSSCSDTPQYLTGTNENYETDNSIESTQGMLKVLVTFDNDSTFFTYAWVTQASRTEITTVRMNLSYNIIPMPGINTIRITRWAPGNFFGRVVLGTENTDFMCCNSVRYSHGKWYLENTTDTIIKLPNTYITVVCTEKCP